MSYSNQNWIKSTAPSSTSPLRSDDLTAKVVKHQFARSEVASLNTGFKNSLKSDICKKLMARPEFKDFSLMQVLEFLSSKALPHLQQSDLTINFNAARWFSKENKTENYTQMYERGAIVGQDEHGNKELLLPNPSYSSHGRDSRTDMAQTYGIVQ